MNQASRGTTPTFVFEIDLDLTGWDVYVTISQSKGKVFTFNDVDVATSSYGCTVTVELTQEDTLKFAAGKALAQVRAVNTDEDIAVKTNTMELWIDQVLLDGVIPQEV